MATPRALPPPEGELVVISQELAERALEASRASERKRMIVPFHKQGADPLQRMFNALQPGTYVRPHRHTSPPRAEVFLVLRGAIDLVVFDDEGNVTFSRRLKAGGAEFGLDLAPGLFHSFIVREPDTLLYEVKAGPYVEASAKDFATWAPEEGSSEVQAYLQRLTDALG
ncbi:MAG: WbuC family cupin fold metalloprotein [Myxococcales bacterium]